MITTRKSVDFPHLQFSAITTAPVLWILQGQVGGGAWGTNIKLYTGSIIPELSPVCDKCHTSVATLLHSSMVVGMEMNKGGLVWGMMKNKTENFRGRWALDFWMGGDFGQLYLPSQLFVFVFLLVVLLILMIIVVVCSYCLPNLWVDPNATGCKCE